MSKRLKSTPWVARTPLPGEVPAQTLPAWDCKDPAKVYLQSRDNPDAPIRPGALDFQKHNSRGYRT